MAKDVVMPPHGNCGLINRIIPQSERESFIKKALKYKAYTISAGDLSMFYRIADGALSPLDGPMDRNEFYRVLEKETIERNEKKYAWTIPVVFPVAKKESDIFEVGEIVAIKNEQGTIVGCLEISDIYHFDKDKYNRAIYGTKRKDHPGPRMVNDDHRDYLLGGKI